MDAVGRLSIIEDLRFVHADGRWCIAELEQTRLRLDFTYRDMRSLRPHVRPRMRVRA